MPKVTPTTTITVDNAVLIVEKLSPNLKHMIVMMDEWRQKQVELTTDLAMVSGALRDIQNTLYVTIKKEQEQAVAKASVEKAPIAGAQLPTED